MEQQEILNNKISVRRECFIYFLIRNNEIVYVGQTKQGIPRIFQHFNTKEYDSYSVCKCNEDELNELEAHYIIKLHPIYNSKTLPTNINYKSIHEIKKLFRINGFAFKRVIATYKLQALFDHYYIVEDFAIAFNQAKKDNIIRYSPKENGDWFCNIKYAQ
jgi:hypothetical protein